MWTPPHSPTLTPPREDHSRKPEGEVVCPWTGGHSMTPPDYAIIHDRGPTVWPFNSFNSIGRRQFDGYFLARSPPFSIGRRQFVITKPGVTFVCLRETRFLP